MVVMAEFEEGSLDEAEGTSEEDLSRTPALINISSEEPSSPPRPTGKRKPRKTTFVEDPLLAEARLQLLRKPDEFDDFAAYVIKTMRKVSVQQQVECQRLVSQVLYETLSGHLTPELRVHGPEPKATAPQFPLSFCSPPPTYPTSTTPHPSYHSGYPQPQAQSNYPSSTFHPPQTPPHQTIHPSHFRQPPTPSTHPSPTFQSPPQTCYPSQASHTSTVSSAIMTSLMSQGGQVDEEEETSLFQM
ncbi:uncharacterized protein LOC134933081 [Pseudophryne corroboree]|uniref:uncharacterized protein LOC134933081 n=1 Tax=Pseudophryne corroboree TaxID=495146 RepID=UPI003081C907